MRLMCASYRAIYAVVAITCVSGRSDSVVNLTYLIYKTNPLSLLQGQIPGVGEFIHVFEFPLGLRESLVGGVAVSFFTPWGKPLWELSVSEQLAQQGSMFSDVSISRGAGVRFVGGYRWYLSERRHLAGLYFTSMFNLHAFRFVLTLWDGAVPYEFLTGIRVLNFLAGFGVQTDVLEGLLFDVVIAFNYRQWRLSVKYLPYGPSYSSRLELPSFWLWFTFYMGIRFVRSVYFHAAF